MGDFSFVFNLISSLMQREKASCILVGGFAVNFYKVSRATADVDFLITKEDFDKISTALLSEGFVQISGHENFAHFQSAGAGLVGVDFMFVDRETFVKMREEGRKFNVGKNEFVVPSLNHLIALKLHSMKFNLKDRLVKDFPDIIGLIRTNQLDVREPHFKELCLKYGSEEIYQRILEVLQ